MLDKLRNFSYTNQLTLLAMAVVLVNPWLAMLLAFMAAALELQKKRPDGDLPAWVLWLPGLVMLAWWGVLKPMPVDDLNRHVLAWRWDYDYRALYPLAEMPQADMWLGFDWLMYQFQRLGLSAQQVAFLWPAVMAVTSYAIFVSNIRKFASAQSVTLLLAVVVLLFPPVAGRAWLGRPEFLYVLLLALALRATTPMRQAAWVLGFLALIPFYWMGWSTAAGVLLFAREKTELRARLHTVALAAVLALAHILFWHWYTGDYLYILDWLKRTIAHVVPNESHSLAQALLDPPGLLLFLWLGYVLLQMDRAALWKHAPVLALLAWLSLSNQVRFLSAMLMVGVPWLLSVTPAPKLSSTAKLMLACACVALGCRGLTTPPLPQPKFAVPDGAFVVSHDPYAAVLYGPANLRVEPSPAIGATPKEVAQGISDGKFDCAKAKALGVTHLIERTMPRKPACATLLEVQDVWRYWKID